MQNKKPTELNAGLVKKLIINVRRIRYSPNIEKVRLIKDKFNNIYALTFSAQNNQVTVYDALTLDYCGRAQITINRNETISAEINKIELDPKYRKHSIGTQVMQFAEHCLKELGAQEISLYASQSRVNTRNSVLRKWYAGLGYEQTTFSHHEPNLFIKKTLKAHPAKYNTLADVVPSPIQQQLKGKKFTFKRLTKNKNFKTFDLELD